MEVVFFQKFFLLVSDDFFSFASAVDVGFGTAGARWDVCRRRNFCSAIVAGICVYKFLCTHIYIYIYVHMYICTHLYIHVYIYIDIYIHISTYIYIYMYMYKYTYT